VMRLCCVGKQVADESVLKRISSVTTLCCVAKQFADESVL
jgi:hypothetical protein